MSTKTQTPAPRATAQASPALAPATTHRVEKESITLEFSDVHEAFEALSVLCLLCWLVRPSVRLAAGPDWLTRHADRDDAARPRQVWRGSALWSPARPAPPPSAPAA